MSSHRAPCVARRWQEAKGGREKNKRERSAEFITGKAPLSRARRLSSDPELALEDSRRQRKIILVCVEKKMQNLRPMKTGTDGWRIEQQHTKHHVDPFGGKVERPQAIPLTMSGQQLLVVSCYVHIVQLICVAVRTACLVWPMPIIHVCFFNILFRLKLKRGRRPTIDTFSLSSGKRGRYIRDREPFRE